MQHAQQLADRYAAVFNEADPAARRRTIEQLWAPDAEQFTKTLHVRGHDALAERISASHDKNVAAGGNRFRAVGNAQVLRDCVTFTWEMVHDGAVRAVGMQVLLVDAQGRVLRDYQFIVS